MREIKFRAWDIQRRSMLPVSSLGFYAVVSPNNDDDAGNKSYELQTELYEDGSGTIECYIMQYTGLKDKNGVEIYEGDVVKMKGLYGEEADEIEANYEVCLSVYDGIKLSMIKTIKPESTISNIFLYSRDFAFFSTEDGSGSIMILKTTWGGRSTTYKERHATRDFKVIGNIYENPELLG